MGKYFWGVILLVFLSRYNYFGREVLPAVTDKTSCILIHCDTSQSAPVSYFIHPLLGNDTNSGTVKEKPFRTLNSIELIKLKPGDQIVLAAGERFSGCLNLINQSGTENCPIQIISENWNNDKQTKSAVVDFRGYASGIHIEDCSFINISNIKLSGDGYEKFNESSPMRCGVLVNNSNMSLMTGIRLECLYISDVFYENKGFLRGQEEVTSANGTQKYGWGIRVISNNENHLIKNVTIADCEISNVSHTGIKLTGNKKNITNVNILNNTVKYTGGPGIQMSEVQTVYAANNIVDHSGSNDDTRKWGRGSGLWTWGSSDVLIEKNKFMNANGPGDSDGAHIDFNCSDIYIQYNLSANNAGGFCEILGNTYNCAYRYNISVNDGYRIKGKNGAFQEGKTLWLSGFQGNNQKRKGPVNVCICNNTIYTDTSIHPKIAFDNSSSYVLIANNIFCLSHPLQVVLGDQYKPDVKNERVIKNLEMKNNLFLESNTWPPEMSLYNSEFLIGNPEFKLSGGVNLQDYIPLNFSILKNKGISVSQAIMNESVSASPMQLRKDILGNPVLGNPSIGAIEPIY